MKTSDPVRVERVEMESGTVEVHVPPDDAVIGRAFQISVMVLVLLGLLGGGAAWFILRPPPPPRDVVRDLGKIERRTTPTVRVPALPFADVTKQAGLAFVHENGAVGEKLLPESMGGGVAFLDYNNDGHADILFVNSDLWPSEKTVDRKRPTMALYKNDGQGNYTDVTAEAGLAVSFYGQGVAVGDYDNDGWVDIFFANVGPNRLYHNNKGTFEDVTAAAGVAGAPQEWSTSTGFFDYDNDGDLDLFVCNYVVWSPEIDRQLECSLVGVGRAYCRPDAFQGTFPYLYRNDGEGKFTDVSEASGVQVKDPNTKVAVAKALGVVFVDLDADGWLDVLVANDNKPNFLFHNKQDGSFEEIGHPAGIAFDSNGTARGAMGIDVAWFRNDDTLGIVIANFANEMTALFCTEGKQMQFTDDAVAVGLGPASRIWLKFGVCFLDVDLDNRIDLLVSNGHLENDIHKVFQSQQYAQPPQLFWNSGTDTTTEFVAVPVKETGRDFAQPIVGRGATYADIDSDGDLDVLLTATGGPPRLLKNEQQLGNHWLRIKLIGRTCNRDAIGASVELHAGGVIQRRLVLPTRSYLSQVELPVTFGLGNASAVDKVIVRWPDGSTQELTEVEIDRVLEVTQHTAETK